jgi:carbon-monoxide dehydrogenase small subunit
MQEASASITVLQCGYCTPGMIMAAIDIVNRKAAPSARR